MAFVAGPLVRVGIDRKRRRAMPSVAVKPAAIAAAGGSRRRPFGPAPDQGGGQHVARHPEVMEATRVALRHDKDDAAQTDAFRQHLPQFRDAQDLLVVGVPRVAPLLPPFQLPQRDQALRRVAA